MMLLTCLFVVFTVAQSVAMEGLRKDESLNDSVGELVTMRCFEPSPFYTSRIETEWVYMYLDICSNNSAEVTVARCEHDSWEYLAYNHHLLGNESCSDGMAYMRSTEPGNFTYKCLALSADDRDTTQHVTFKITINALEDSSPCIAKYLPSTQRLVFDFVCRSHNQQACLYEDETNFELFIQNDNDVRITPNITLSNKIVTRLEINENDNVSQYRCISHNQSSPCVVDNVTLSNPISVTPIVNQVTEGSDVTFKCQFGEGQDSGLEYEWRLSQHIDLSRIKGITSSKLKISKVRSEDDGVVVTCVLLVNGTLFYSEALLTIISETMTPTKTMSTATARTFATNDGLAKTEGTTHFTHTPSSAPKTHPWRIIVIFAIVLICGLCLLVITLLRSKIQWRIKLTMGENPDVGGDKLLAQCDSNTMLSRRKPSVTSQPLPLIPSPETTPVLSPITNHDQVHETKAMSSSTDRPTGQFPPLSHLLTISPISSDTYNVLQEQPPPLSISSSSATIPKPPGLNPSRSLSTSTQKSETISESEPMTPCDTQYPIPFPPKNPSQPSCTGSPMISRVRKASATDYPLPPIPRSPGQCEDPQSWHEAITKLPSSKELPDAVATPVLHVYSHIQDEPCERKGHSVHGLAILPKSDASAPSSPSAVITNHRTDYTCATVQKHLTDLETGRPHEPMTQESNICTAPDEDTDAGIPSTSSQSIYHTIDEQASDVQSFCHTDNASSAVSDTTCSIYHIYETPVDDIPAKGNEQSGSDMPFYFTLESEEKMESKKVTKCQSTTKDQATKPIEHQPHTPVKESE